MKKRWFTLLEIIIAITGFFVIMTVVINAYFSTVKYRYIFQAKSTLLETTYYMFERINLLMKDYTIDYEEYFNRSRVGCDTWRNFTWWHVWSNWYCDLYTFWWNAHSFPLVSSWQHNLYYCTSISAVKASGFNVVWPHVSFTNWCITGSYQSFWQYAKQFFDVKQNTDSDPSIIDDSDDTDLWKWPHAILSSTGVKELYLISKNKEYRVFLRRALIATWEFDGKPWLSDNESLYSLQMLKLKSFDAWNTHNFSSAGSWSWIYDGVIDTWTCDYAQWFLCAWTGLGSLWYSWYRIPINSLQYNSWWVNLFDNNITVIDRNIAIYPSKDPDLVWAEPNYQMSPYFVISVKTKLYWWVWYKRLQDSIRDYQFSLQTTFTVKDNY
jgi:hypothetical protein